jgi:hypothetical protein
MAGRIAIVVGIALSLVWTIAIVQSVLKLIELIG